MPLFSDIQIDNNLRVALWRLEEPESFFLEKMELSAAEEEELRDLKGHRRVEMLAARWLLHEMTGEERRKNCHKDQYGKPFLTDFPQEMSISHSMDWIAAIFSPKPVGIDIQIITEKIARIASKFMRPEEAACLSGDHFLEHLHVFWGAKEALYKAYGKKELDFRGHIFLHPFDYNLEEGKCSGYIHKEDYHESFDIFYRKIDDYLLVYAVESNTID